MEVGSFLAVLGKAAEVGVGNIEHEMIESEVETEEEAHSAAGLH